jgi:hypothetical protein
VFTFLKTCGRLYHRKSSCRSFRAARRPIFEQLGGGLFQLPSGRRPESMKPAVEALEERQLMSIVVGGGIGGVSLAGEPQQLSNMSSVTDSSGHTVLFEITPDQSLWYSTSPGVWHQTTGKALSVSAGVDPGGAAVAYVIGTNHAVYEYSPTLDQWNSLGGYAFSISATQGPAGFVPSLVYAIGSDAKLYVNDGVTGWHNLGSPVGTSTNGELVTISTVNYYSGSTVQSVCYATDQSGSLWLCTNEIWNGGSPGMGGFGWIPSYSANWASTGGTNAIQIAAGYDYSDNPVVYSLTWDHRVWVYDKGAWSSVGDKNTYALEISAGRSWGANDPSRNVVFAIGGNHSVYIYDNRADQTWANSTTWQDLGGYATAITAEGVIDGHFVDNGVFANNYYGYVYVYQNGWDNLYGPQMHQSTTPLFY